jgi:hypothetical protein
MDDRDSMVLIPAGTGNFSFHHRIQSGCGARPASYPMGTRGSFPGDRPAGGVKLATHFHLARGQIMRGTIPKLPQYVFMSWGSI